MTAQLTTGATEGNMHTSIIQIVNDDKIAGSQVVSKVKGFAQVGYKERLGVLHFVTTDKVYRYYSHTAVFGINIAN
jgi:hypothetical protein